MGELEHCSEHDQVHVVDISATEGGGLAKDVQNGGTDREERREDTSSSVCANHCIRLH